jgi:hypothetical protein
MTLASRLAAMTTLIASLFTMITWPAFGLRRDDNLFLRLDYRRLI